MTQNRSFQRKVIYVSLIGLLAIPLSLLGRPAVKGTSGGQGSEGGVLARSRSENDLTQASLGDIDPASETMKLATLGLKGIAVSVLWHQANELKDSENWEAFSATVNQIIKLQPNFIEVWQYQAHNIAYNVSVEFDDYQGRYDWVKKGLDFLVQGLAYNRRNYDLLRELGTFYGLKLGRSDERVQFRSMFRKDYDYHERLSAHIPMGDRVKTAYGVDNWLVARQWFLQAENKVREGVPLTANTSHLMFYRESPSQFRNAAMDMEEEFRPEEPARRMWEEALEAWNAYGNRTLKTSWETQLRLNDRQVAGERVLAFQAKLDEIVPGERDRMVAELFAALPPDMQAAYNKPKEERTLEEAYLALETLNRLQVDDAVVAKAAPPEKSEEVYRILRQLQLARVELQRIDQYRGTVNYNYWSARCEAEQTPTNLAARAALYDAQVLQERGVLTKTEQVDPLTGETTVTLGVREKYEEAFGLWSEIFRQFPVLIDGITTDDLRDSVESYRTVLNLLGEPFPEPFVLDFVYRRQSGESVADQINRLEENQNTKPTTVSPSMLAPVAPQTTPIQPPRSDNRPEGGQTP